MTRFPAVAAVAKFLLLAVALPLVWAGGALAHGVVAAVYLDGATIEGEVGFSNGDPAAHATIEVVSADGTPILTTTTDATGFFAFEAARRIDHVIKAKLGAGHVAEMVVTAAELPDSLGAGDGVGEATGERIIERIGAAAGEPAAPSAEPVPESPGAGAPVGDETALRAMVREAVNAEIRPLRRQLVEYENTVRWHDVLGGLGYIAGLAGLALWVLSRRRPPGADT